MATLEQVAAALKAADAAGNADDAKRLAAAYRSMQSAQPAGEAQAADAPPAGAVPGSKEYATWALEQAKAGKKLPVVSKHTEFEEPKPNGLMDKAFTAAGSFLEGMPLVGSTAIDLAKKGRAAVQGMTPEAVDQEFAAAKEANPITSTAAGIGGSVAALAPLGATAMGGKLLGMTGGVGSRVGFGALSGSALSGGDALTRGATGGEAAQTALFGGALGAALPLAGAGFRKAVSPMAKSSTKSAAADLLKSEGVELTAGQRTGSRALKARESELGGNAALEFTEQQGKQFTAAALKRAGIAGDTASHDVIDNAFTSIGKQFDDLAARNNIQPDKKLAQDLQAAWRRFEGSTNPQTRPKVIERLIADIYGKGNAAQMSGGWYKSTRSELGRLSKSQNPELAEAARDFQFALDDVMERTLAKANSPDAGAWKEARRLHKNLLVVEDAATRAGAQSADGIITPAALRSAAIRQNKRAYARGKNEFAELADAGVSLMAPLPDSGTANRLGAKMLLPAGAVAGGTMGAALGPVGALVGGLSGAALPWAAGRAMLSRPGRAYLGNSLMAGPARKAFVSPAALPLEVTRKREPVEITVRGAG